MKISTPLKSAALKGLLLLWFFPLLSQAQTYRVVRTFVGDASGGYPGKSLAVNKAGDVYGSTVAGGVLDSGTLFRLGKDGDFTTIYLFPGNPNGSSPFGGLVLDGSGNVYGTTTYGGGDAYAGTVFRLTGGGAESVLYSFLGTPDGANPQESLVRDDLGDLYGTTRYGGTLEAGTVFKINSEGDETVLHSFGGAEGSFPEGPVVRDPEGNLFGTVPNASKGGCVYKIDASGNFSVLYNFAGRPDGMGPTGSLARDSAGNIYGTTAEGGTDGFGIIFKIDHSGNETILHSFTGKSDGASPLSGVIRDSNGNLYGTTFGGSRYGLGTVFTFTAAGHLTTLHSFRGGTDGEVPYGGVIRDAKGNLYGTTWYGGKYNAGIVYKIAP
jgi:uncharacterized repeat protein (TIGR03803 family)